MALILTCDRRRLLEPLPFSDPGADALRGATPPDEWRMSWHLISPEGRIFSGGAAIPVVCRLLPGFGLAGRLSGAAPDVTQGIYALVARNRARIGPRIPRAWLEWASRRLDGRIRVE